MTQSGGLILCAGREERLMQISGAVAISSAIPSIRGCGDQPWEGGWTLLCQPEGFVGSRTKPSIHSQAFPIFQPFIPHCNSPFPSPPVPSGLARSVSPVFGCPSFLCLSLYLPPRVCCCAVAAGVKPRDSPWPVPAAPGGSSSHRSHSWTWDGEGGWGGSVGERRACA